MTAEMQKTDKEKCPLCESGADPSLTAKGHLLFDCNLCGHRFLPVSNGVDHISQVFSDAYFKGGGAGYSNYLNEEKILVERGKIYAKKMSALMDGPGELLDVGCAAGCILRGFIESGWKGLGLEPNPTMASIARNKFELDVKVGSLESFEADRTFDLVTMIQVAAHFHDPKRAFRNAAKLLRENGIMLVETWNRDSVFARLFGRHWHEYSPPSVVQWFSQKGLTQFLSGLGFEQISSRRTSKKISGEHARSLLEYRIGKNPLLGLVPRTLRFPYPAEDLFYSVFRKRSPVE